MVRIKIDTKLLRILDKLKQLLQFKENSIKHVFHSLYGFKIKRAFVRKSYPPLEKDFSKTQFHYTYANLIASII